MSSLPNASMPSPVSSSGMKSSAGTAMYPLHRCKTIHLVRHAQGVHNVEGEKDHSAYTSPSFFDAPITPLGWRQVDYLREHVKNCGLAEKIELVICSPLLRTMQTAVGVFGGESYTGGGGAPPLMVENAGQSERLAISSLNCPPFLAVENCRERLQGGHPCDKRRSIAEYRTIFPAIDFSLESIILLSIDKSICGPLQFNIVVYILTSWCIVVYIKSLSLQIENDEDVREAHKSVAARGMKFMDCYL
ncbi:hypothetical protein PVAP13_7KG073009 [Panicum virgatum]|uniref:Phosphoglycerate mutase-like protein n=1 Tax=Panicum virgatum TaxID=38727 RepID=A0A8T0QC89_PANVG|nr:hypothetical protein PVAP13_7KG073009 [Panicum virgatum]KAG2570207.1 hypothetical protein PVAP13_7KG073009 [Panicum virgatum]KAG2570208.1 hypothetical protein PVAP13_7KG073009 [Panicum virgatum]